MPTVRFPGWLASERFGQLSYTPLQSDEHHSVGSCDNDDMAKLTENEDIQWTSRDASVRGRFAASLTVNITLGIILVIFLATTVRSRKPVDTNLLPSPLPECKFREAVEPTGLMMYSPTRSQNF